MENSTLIFAALEIIFLHEGKEEGMTLDGGWKKTTLTSHVCSCFFTVCMSVLASNQFFVCIAVLAFQSARWLTVLVRWLGNNSRTFDGCSVKVSIESIVSVNGKKRTAATNVSKLRVDDVLELTFPDDLTV